MKPFSFLLLFSFLFTCCNQKTEDRTSTGIQEIVKKEEPSFILINSQGDTIPTGVPVPAKGKYIDPGSYPSPQFVPFETPPKVVPATNRTYPAQILKVVPVPANLPVITPGKNGVPLPKIIPAESHVVPAHHPKPINALPPRNNEASNFNTQYLSIEQGMPSSMIKDVLEDRKGNIWIATWGDGLACYDGHRINHFTVAEGLATNYIISIMQDHQDHLWLGTMEGLIRFDGHHFTHYSIEGLGRGWHGGIHSMLMDKKENIWIGTGSQGLIRFDGDNFTYFTTKEGLISNSVFTIMEDSRGRLWIGTIKGMNRYDPPPNQDRSQMGSFTLYTDKEGTFSNQVNGIIEDRQGDLWFGVGNTLIHFDGDNFTCFRTKEGLIHGFISTMMEDSGGNLWCGTWDGVLFAFDGINFSDYTEIETQIYTIIEDSGGNIWMATNGDGLRRLNQERFIHYTTKDGLIHNNVTKILEDSKGNLWYGSWGGGACLYSSGDKGEPGTYTHLGAAKRGFRWSHSILEDGAGKIWIGGNLTVGVSRYEGNGWTIYPWDEILPTGIQSILEDSQRNIWFGTNRGLIRLNHNQPGIDQREHFTRFTSEDGLSGNWTQPIVEDRQGKLWFITGQGVSCYEPNGSDPSTEGTFTHITTNEGLSNNYVLSMLEDSQGQLWFGTGGSGVSCYNGDKFSHLSTKEGLGNDYIQSIVEDKQKNIWMGTSKGITLLVPNSTNSSTAKSLLKEQYKCITFDQADGLKRLDFQRNSVCLDSQDRIWWGTLNGVAMLDLKHFALPTEPPKTVSLSHIEVGQAFVDYRGLSDTAYCHTLPFGKELSQSFDSVAAFYNYPLNLTLPHHLNHLTFHFSAIDWGAPHKIIYSYRIKGLDKDWSPAQTEPKADYRNLPSGTFTLQVKAIGVAQVWSEIFEYTFIIFPPWWLTWWAKVLYGLLIALGLYGLYQFLLHRQLALAEAQRLIELDQVKTRLYTNITHEFRTPLAIILGMADQMKSDPQNWFNEGLKLIRRNGRQLLQLINQLLDLSKLESGHLSLKWVNGNIIPFLQYLAESFHSYADSKDIRMHFMCDMAEFNMDYDPEKLQQVVGNFLSNAIKFTPAGGDVYMIIESGVLRDENDGQASVQHSTFTSYFFLKVKDTGPGIPPQHLPHIFDRFYQADASHTRQGEGTGIGLALTRELVRAMGGSIEVESQLEKGTRFTVRLPVNQRAEKAQQEPNPAAPSPIADFLMLEAEKNEAVSRISPNNQNVILLVEDNADLLTYLASFLLNDYQVITARDGKEGVDTAIEWIPDLIVSDVMMPEMDGFELCHKLKSDERTNHIPIILLTAKTGQLSKLEGLRQGADAFLSKPFNREELLLRIEKLIALRHTLHERFQKTGALRKMIREPAGSKEEAFMQRVLQVIEENLQDENFGMPQLCKELHLSRTHVFRKLKALTGKSATALIRSMRLEKGKELLETTHLNVTEVCYEVGFNSPSYFSKKFQEEFGFRPGKMHKR